MKSLVHGAGARLAPLAWRMERRARLLILMYHRVLPAGHPARSYEQPGMYVAPETLERNIALLRRHFQLVHLDDWVREAKTGRAPAGLHCALTFDDGWRDNLEFALPVLQRMQAPATIFLVPGMVGRSYGLWGTRLARLVKTLVEQRAKVPDELDGRLGGAIASLQRRGGVPTSESLDAVVVAAKSRHADAAIDALLDDLAAYSDNRDEQRDLMDWDEIGTLAASGLVRYGSHTRTHLRLAGSVPESRLLDEIAGSRSDLAERLGVAPTLFCYPNGDHSAAAVELVERHYAAAVTTQRGWNDAASSLGTLRRVGIHDDVGRQDDAFLSRIWTAGYA